jgi:hypothetical protein
VGILGLFALLNLFGLGESAVVALVIFIGERVCDVVLYVRPEKCA